MKTTIDQQGGLQCRVTVQVPVSHVDGLVAARLRELGATLKLKGFRKGKIPPRVLSERYGADVRRQVVEETVQKACRDAMQQESLESAGPVHVGREGTRAGDDLTYVATVEIFPAYTVSGADALTVDRPVVEIGAGDVDELIERLRQQLRSWKTVDRQSRNGDRLLIDIDGTMDARSVGGRRAVPVVIGEGDIGEDTETRLVGLAVGDGIVREVRYEDDFHDVAVAGKTVQYRIVVRGVTEASLPDVDGEFCRQFGVDSGNPEELRALAEADLKREAAAQVQTDVKLQLLGQLVQRNPLDLPAVLVEEEAGRLRHQMMQREGSDESSDSPPVDAFRAAAERNVHMGLMVRGVFREQGLQVLREEINDRIAELCPPGEDSAAWQDRYYRNPGLLSQVEDAVMDDKVVDWLLRRAAVTDTPLSFLELIQKRAPEPVSDVNIFRLIIS